MAFSGTHAYIAILIKNQISYRKWFFASFLLGSIIPDIDYLFSKLHLFISIPDSLSILNKTFAHSIVFTIIVYLSLLITYEIKKNKKYINMANGVLLGISFHIFIDLFLWYDKIDLFWPLPLEGIHIWNITLSKKIFILVSIMEFVFFRIFASFSIQSILYYPGENKYFIKTLTIWMKLLTPTTVIFIATSYFINIYFVQLIFFICYIPSLYMMIYTVYYLWDSFDYFKNKETSTIEEEYNERKNLININ